MGLKNCWRGGMGDVWRGALGEVIWVVGKLIWGVGNVIRVCDCGRGEKKEKTNFSGIVDGYPPPLS